MLLDIPVEKQYPGYYMPVLYLELRWTWGGLEVDLKESWSGENDINMEAIAAKIKIGIIAFRDGVAESE